MSTPHCARAFTFRSARLGALVAVLALGCDDDRLSVEDGSSIDHPDNGVVAIDEALLHGEAKGGELAIEIPLRSRATVRAWGVFRVTLRHVGGDAVQGTNVRYDLPAGGETTLHAKLRMPDDVDKQADLVRYVVRVEQLVEDPLRVTRSLLHVITPVEVRLEGPAKLRAEKAAVYRALLQDARTRQPVPDAPVALRVTRDADVGDVETIEATSDDTGVARFEVETLAPGSYTVTAAATAAGAVYSTRDPFRRRYIR